MTALTAFLTGLAAVASPAGDLLPGEGTEPSPTHSAPAGPDPVYPAEFYAAFQPQTALDMLDRTPGFILSEGSAVRGFGGAAGNVLIDGQRPTVKGGGVAEVLRRIGAARVERIVLLRGTDAAEAQGQPLVANVVLRTDAAGSGNASLTLSRTADGRVAPSARISHARRIAGWHTNVELFGEVVRFPSDAIYRDYDAAGTLTRTRVEHQAASAPEYGAAVSSSGALAGGTLTANLRLNGDGYISDRTIGIFAGPALGTPPTIRTIAYEEKGWSGELGLDWTRRLGADWTTKLVALGRIERDGKDEDYIEPGYRGVSKLKRRPIELVARATLAREGDRAFRPELGMEIAYNRLASHLDYAEDTGVGLIPVVLSNADTRASELRGEAFVNTTLRVNARLNLEAGAAFELSRIRVTGAAASEQSLSYLKPSAALVWSPTGQTQLRIGIRRTVDQLDFTDFAASVDQADGRPIGGNSQLRPARITRALVRLDHRWGKGGAIAIEAYHQWHAGLLGYLVLPNGDEALGTIGNARWWGVTAQIGLPLDALLSGARLTLDGALRKSRLDDPVTRLPRTMDDIAPRSLTAEFRHDVPKLKSSWGIEFTAARQADVFYTGEILTWRNHPIWGAYVETTALAGFKTTLTASGIGGKDTYRLRRFYRPNRSRAFSGSETRDLQQGVAVSLMMAKSF
jgi:hypothetical protein